MPVCEKKNEKRRKKVLTWAICSCKINTLKDGKEKPFGSVRRKSTDYL